jgi:hypothetical protein
MNKGGHATPYAEWNAHNALSFQVPLKVKSIPFDTYTKEFPLRIVLPLIALALASGCLGPTNQRLDAVNQQGERIKSSLC